jgi:hypothetical protein
MVDFYIAQEKAFATGISGEWPNVIPKPGDPNGRLVKLDVNNPKEVFRAIKDIIDSASKE